MLLLSCTRRRTSLSRSELAAGNIPSPPVRLNPFDRGAPTEPSVGAFGRDTARPGPARHHRLWGKSEAADRIDAFIQHKAWRRGAACVLALRHLNAPLEDGGGGVSSEDGESQKWGLYCFLRQGERVHMPSLLLCRVWFNLVINMLYVGYLKRHVSR